MGRKLGWQMMVTINLVKGPGSTVSTTNLAAISFHVSLTRKIKHTTKGPTKRVKNYPSNQAQFSSRSKQFRRADKKRKHDEQCNNPKKQLSGKKYTEDD